MLTNKYLKDLIAGECAYRLSDDVMQRFIDLMDRREIKKGCTVIEEGSVDRDIYVVGEGVFSSNYLNGTDERTFAFALPGTLMYSAHSFYLGEPAIYSFEACCDSVVYHCSKRDYDKLVRESHEFAQWALSCTQCQLYFFEKKNAVINGDAAERLNAMLRNRPEIFEKVPKKTIASYLGITQQYLSVLLKKIR